MNLFLRNRKRQPEDAAGRALPSRSALECAAEYAGRLTLPKPEGAVKIRLAGADKGKLYYLLFLSDGTAEGSLDAGYAAGQTASFLRFQGIEPELVRGLPDGVQDDALPDCAQRGADPAGELQCMAALTFGRRKTPSRSAASQDRFCICTEERKNWGDELLAFTKVRYPKTFRWLGVSRGESRIYFSGRKINRKNTGASAFETGVAISNIMAAADELWLDLEMVQLEALQKEEYLFGVCRKMDGRTVRRARTAPEKTAASGVTEAKIIYA